MVPSKPAEGNKLPIFEWKILIVFLETKMAFGVESFLSRKICKGTNSICEYVKCGQIDWMISLNNACDNTD